MDTSCSSPLMKKAINAPNNGNKIIEDSNGKKINLLSKVSQKNSKESYNA